MFNRTCFAAALLIGIGLEPAQCAAQTKGTFAAGIDYPAGPPVVATNTGYLINGITASDPHVGDFNGDGRPDLVVAAGCLATNFPACPSSNAAIAVYLSNGDGTFQPAILTAVEHFYLRAIAIGDFNRDGILDVAAAIDDEDSETATLQILLGKGDGTFASVASYTINGVGFQGTLATGDFNNDGKPDIVVGSAPGGPVSEVEVFLGNGDGTFSGPTAYPYPLVEGIFPVVGDFNGDGNQDIVAASGSASFAVLLGNGAGTFTQTTVSLPPNFGAEAIAAADLNSDGKLDLALGGVGGIIQVLFGNGDGTFQSPIGYNSPFYTSSIVASDLNGDGRPDLIVGATGVPNMAAILLNNGQGAFGAAALYSLGGSVGSEVVAADLNGDGKTDLVGVNYCPQVDIFDKCPDSSIGVLLGNGDGTMRGAAYLPFDSSGPDVAAADFNGDGFQDLVYTCSYPCQTGSITLLLSNGAGGFQAPVNIQDTSLPSGLVTVADFNGDGRPDLAISDCASCQNPTISIFLNTGNGTFSGPVSFPVPVLALGFSSSLLTGDFNGDGKPDLAVFEDEDGSTGALVILIGNGDGTFQSPVSTTLPTSGYAITVLDLNRDGLADLAIIVPDTSYPVYNALAVQVFIGRGDGTFAAGSTYGGVAFVDGGFAGGLATADVNLDGYPDIVVGGYCDSTPTDMTCTRGQISVLLGSQTGTFTASYSAIN